MQRLLAAAGLLGVLDGLVALAVAALVRPRPADFGWFAYAPLDSVVACGFSCRFSWVGVLAVCAALALVNGLVVLVAVQRGWARAGSTPR